jgi:hypothetical protein
MKSLVAVSVDRKNGFGVQQQESKDSDIFRIVDPSRELYTLVWKRGGAEIMQIESCDQYKKLKSEIEPIRDQGKEVSEEELLKFTYGKDKSYYRSNEPASAFDRNVSNYLNISEKEIGKPVVMLDQSNRLVVLTDLETVILKKLSNTSFKCLKKKHDTLFFESIIADKERVKLLRV